MHSPVRAWLTLCSVALLLPVLASEGASQTVRVKRNVNLRRDSTSARPPIRLLEPPEELELLRPDTSVTGYLFVLRAETEDTGWVYARNVDVIGAADSSLSVAAAVVADAIDTGWAKPTPDIRTFHGPTSGKTCGPDGDSRGDKSTNRLKNRVDVPASYHPVIFQAIATLEYPATKSPKRDKWPAESVAVIEKYEGAAVSVVGFLVALKPQAGEAVNCDMAGALEADWHMSITEMEGQGEEDGIVVETTPRVRASHPKWTPTRLAPWVSSPNPIRVSGWLMFDPAHRAHLKSNPNPKVKRHFRTTLWEVHPITKLEVWQDSAFVEVDSLP